MPAAGTFFTALGVGLGIGGGAVAGGALAVAGGAAGFGFAIGSFLAANAGTLLLLGGSLVLSAVRGGRRPEESTLNVRIAAGPRWWVAGDMRLGGNAVYGAFDADGAFWYVIVHCDSELIEIDHYRLDDIPVTLNVSNQVTNEEFQAETEGGLFGLLPGEKKPFFTIWTTTYDPDDPTPPPVAAFTAANPAWTSDHKLVGTTYSIIKIDPVDDTSKPGIYKWRGAFGAGEPSLTLVARWSRIYDPREPSHDIDDPSTWGSSRNAALVWAWNRYRQFGFNNPMEAINWTMVAGQADICDETVLDKDSNPHPRYAVGVAFDEGKNNSSCEQEILLACDGIVLQDNEGKLYCKVGYWEEPSLLLTGARDILAMASREAEDGESETDGVVVSFTDPSAGYIEQPAAPWNNADFYDPARTPNYIKISIPAIQSHNQAVRIAKAIGKRSQATHRLAPTVGLRSLRARRERVIELEYDTSFAGAYQIVAPVEIDQAGMTGLLFLVPVNENTWTLLPGEEGGKPVHDDLDDLPEVPLAEGVEVEAIFIAGTGSASFQIIATFDAPTSPIYSYQFSYSLDGGDTWTPMVTNMSALRAESSVIDATFPAYVRYRTRTSGGRSSGWSSPVIINGSSSADTTSITADTTLFSADAA